MKRKMSLILILISVFLLTTQPSQATTVLKQGTVNYNHPTEILYADVEANNYSISVGFAGIDDSFGKVSCIITKDSDHIYSVFEDGYSFDLDREIKFPLDTGTYKINITLETTDFEAYCDYQILFQDYNLIISPKSDEIIAEAPYGITFIFLGVISYVLISRSRKKK